MDFLGFGIDQIWILFGVFGVVGRVEGRMGVELIQVMVDLSWDLFGSVKRELRDIFNENNIDRFKHPFNKAKIQFYWDLWYGELSIIWN